MSLSRYVCWAHHSNHLKWQLPYEPIVSLQLWPSTHMIIRRILDFVVSLEENILREFKVLDITELEINFEWYLTTVLSVKSLSLEFTMNCLSYYLSFPFFLFFSPSCQISFLSCPLLYQPTESRLQRLLLYLH